MLFAGEEKFIIGDANAHEFVGDGESVYVNGDIRYLSRKPRVEPYGAFGATFESTGIKALTRDEIKQRAIFLADTESRISDQIDFEGKDQNGTNYCWVNGVTGAVEACRRYHQMPHVDLSPASVGGPITHFSNEGGWGENARKQFTNVGAARTELWPANGINAKYLTDEVRKDYENHKIILSIDGRSNVVEELWTLLVLGYPCPLGLDWWGHLIYAVDVVVLPDGSLSTRFRNSWKDTWGSKNKHGRGGFGILTESKSRGDFFGIADVTNSVL